MSRILATYPSSSNPGKRYNIIKGNDNVVYCDCPSWRMSPAPKDCKHLRHFTKARLGAKSTPQAIYPIYEDSEIRAEVNDIQSAINAAVQDLS